MSRWYWVVDCDNTVEDPLVIDRDDLGMAPEQLCCGETVTQWNSFAWLRASRPEDDGTPDDSLQNHLGLPVHSARLRAALEHGGIRGIQYLPVRIFRPNGTELRGFCIVNIVIRRKALDAARTEIARFPAEYFLPERRGKVRSVKRVTLRRDAIVDCDILRLDEYPMSIYVSEKFKTIFERGGFSGCSFHEVATS